METIVIYVAGFFAAAAALWSGRALALRHRYLDRPGGRKQHRGAVPPIGGLVIIPVFTLLYCLTMPAPAKDWPLFAGLFLLLGAGAYDDRYGIHPWIKFAVQIIAAALVVFVGGVTVKNLGPLFGGDDLRFYGIGAGIFALAALVLLINALNMMDGLDGLCGGVCAAILIWLIAAATKQQQPAAIAGALCLLAPLLAFLAFNMRHPWRERAAVFLGDAGSMTLALIIGWLCLKHAGPPQKIMWPISVAWLLAVPVMDTLALFTLRLLKKRHPFSADRNHLHHRFEARGFSVPGTVLSVIGAVMLTGAIGVVGMWGHIPPALMAGLWILALAVYITISLRPSARRTFES